MPNPNCLSEEEGRSELPTSVDNKLDPELVEPVAKVIYAALQAGAVDVAAYTAGRIYTRKEEQSVDYLGDPRNPSYSSDGDDYFFQIAVRVPFSGVQELAGEIQEVERLAFETRLRKARAELDAAEERAAHAQENLAEAKADAQRLTKHQR